MCGIFGLIARQGRLNAASVAASAGASLAHRGPDANGVYTATAGGWDLALAHARLSIIDLSDAGRQPMSSADGRLHLSYNGEIYNYPTLRAELESAYPFRGHSDTETLLAGLQLHGFDYVTRLRGMYAYGVFEPARHLLRLARDPFGIKPLYYYSSPDLFLFASEIRTLLATGLVPRRLSRPALTSYLQTGSVAAEETILDGVRALSPDCELEVSFAAAELHTRAIPRPFPAAPGPASRVTVAEELREHLKASVRRHLVSDVPVGLFLSGGIDSSALLALMREVDAGDIQTFSVVFGDNPLSEAVQARQIAAQYNATHHELELSEDRLLGDFPAALAAMDQPTMDGVNSYIVSQGVREAGLKVALSGLGGDELFGGYPSFARQASLSRWGTLARLAAPLFSVAKKTLRLEGVRWEKAHDLLAAAGNPEQVYSVSRRMFPVEDVTALLSDPAPFERPREALPADAFNAISHLELTRYMRDILLRDSDVMSMAHSIEVRVPFVDVELARFVLSLPGAWKWNPTRPKSLLLEALGHRLPEYVWNRRKMGFTLPFADWMCGRLRPEIHATFSDDTLLKSCGLQPATARRILANFLSNPARWRWSRPWSLYVLARWCAHHGVTV